MMLKLKLQYFGNLMRRVDSLGKTLMLGGIGGRRRRGQQRMSGWMASLTRWTWVWVNSGSWWWTGRPGVLRFMGSQRVGHDLATELNWNLLKVLVIQKYPQKPLPWASNFQWGGILILPHHVGQCHYSHWVFLKNSKYYPLLHVFKHCNKNNFGNNLLFIRHPRQMPSIISHHVTFFTKDRCVETIPGVLSLSWARSHFQSNRRVTISETSPRPLGEK